MVDKNNMHDGKQDDADSSKPPERTEKNTDGICIEKSYETESMNTRKCSFLGAILLLCIGVIIGSIVGFCISAIFPVVSITTGNVLDRIGIQQSVSGMEEKNVYQDITFHHNNDRSKCEDPISHDEIVKICEAKMLTSQLDIIEMDVPENENRTANDYSAINIESSVSGLVEDDSDHDIDQASDEQNLLTREEVDTLMNSRILRFRDDMIVMLRHNRSLIIAFIELQSAIKSGNNYQPSLQTLGSLMDIDSIPEVVRSNAHSGVMSVDDLAKQFRYVTDTELNNLTKDMNDTYDSYENVNETFIDFLIRSIKGILHTAIVIKEKDVSSSDISYDNLHGALPIVQTLLDSGDLQGAVSLLMKFTDGAQYDDSIDMWLSKANDSISVYTAMDVLKSQLFSSGRTNL